MGWQEFDSGAQSYEDWYASPRGRRADACEKQLLAWLLGAVPDASSALEIGCGTGHFTAVLAEHGLTAIGLDRAPAMLATMRHLRPGIPAVLGDAHALPFNDKAFDVTVMIATLEFLDRPETAMADAVRVGRRGLIMIVLNAWSLGGFSRRWGPQSRGRQLGRARDYSLPQLHRLVRTGASDRIERIVWRSGLYPAAPAEFLAPVPLGDVIGMAVTLRP